MFRASVLLAVLSALNVTACGVVATPLAIAGGYEPAPASQPVPASQSRQIELNDGNVMTYLNQASIPHEKAVCTKRSATLYFSYEEPTVRTIHYRFCDGSTGERSKDGTLSFHFSLGDHPEFASHSKKDEVRLEDARRQVAVLDTTRTRRELETAEVIYGKMMDRFEAKYFPRKKYEQIVKSSKLEVHRVRGCG